MATGKTKPEPLTIGETTKKTINKTIVIGAAFTAAVILTPAAYARETHHEPDNGIQLATDIVNLVRAIVEPTPPPVVVEKTVVVEKPVVVEKTVVVEKPVVVEPEPVVVAAAPKVVTTTPTTVIVTAPEVVTIPDYSYILYGNEYIPYYEGWLYYHDEWRWIGAKARPAAPPRWKPEPHRHGAPDHRKVIVLPGHRHEPAPAIHRAPPRHEPVIVRHEAPGREPARTVVVRPEKKNAPRGDAPKTVRTDRKDAPRGDAPKHDAPKKGR